MAKRPSPIPPVVRVPFRALMRAIAACRACRDGFGHEPRPVLSGGPRARVFQVSQAPSLAVHRSGVPFADASGAALRGWYGVDEPIFYDPANFYITACAHCFPGRTPGGADRPPPPRCARLHMAKELAAVDFRVAVLIGRHAADLFFPGAPFAERVFSTDLTVAGRPAFVLPHPSPLNRRWRKEHPAFEAQVLPRLRGALRSAGVPEST